MIIVYNVHTIKYITTYISIYVCTVTYILFTVHIYIYINILYIYIYIHTYIVPQLCAWTVVAIHVFFIWEAVSNFSVYYEILDV